MRKSSEARCIKLWNSHPYGWNSLNDESITHDMEISMTSMEAKRITLLFSNL